MRFFERLLGGRNGSGSSSNSSTSQQITTQQQKDDPITEEEREKRRELIKKINAENEEKIDAARKQKEEEYKMHEHNAKILMSLSTEKAKERFSNNIRTYDQLIISALFTNVDATPEGEKLLDDHIKTRDGMKKSEIKPSSAHKLNDQTMTFLSK